VHLLVVGDVGVVVAVLLLNACGLHLVHHLHLSSLLRQAPHLRLLVLQHLQQHVALVEAVPVPVAVLPRRPQQHPTDSLPEQPRLGEVNVMCPAIWELLSNPLLAVGVHEVAVALHYPVVVLQQRSPPLATLLHETCTNLKQLRSSLSSCVQPALQKLTEAHIQHLSLVAVSAQNPTSHVARHEWKETSSTCA
jgi:hypothetical protein